MIVIREEIPKKGENSTPGALYHHIHAKFFLLWCVPISATSFGPTIYACAMAGIHYMAADKIV